MLAIGGGAEGAGAELGVGVEDVVPGGGGGGGAFLFFLIEAVEDTGDGTSKSSVCCL